MSNPNDFIIENGVLTKYVGPGGDVVIPDGVTEIAGGLESGAFYRCQSVTSVKISPSVTEIGWLAFAYCTGLKSVELPAGITIVNYGVFHDCSSLEHVVIPEGVTEIGREAFCGCKKLADVSLPESLIEIGERAFQDCAKLSAIRIPKAVTSIGMYAFSGCGKLKSMEFSGEKAELKKDVFSSKLPAGLIPQLPELAAHMADGAVKQYVLNPKVWAQLDTEAQAGIFLSKQGKALLSAYEKCIAEERLEPLGAAILTRLQAKPSQAECGAAAAFMTLFSAKAPAALLKELYAQLKACKNSAKALKVIETDLLLQSMLS